MSESSLSQLKQRFEALSERERLLVFVAILALAWGLAELLFLGRLSNQRIAEAQQVEALREQVTTLNARQTELNEQITNGPLQAAQAQEADLLARIAKADLALRGENVRYLDAERARQVLHLLLKGTGLKLVSMRSLPVEIALSTRTPSPAVMAPESDDAATDANVESEDEATVEADTASNTQPGSAPGIGLDLYRHPIEVQVEGSFADMVEYLSRLEQSDWSLMWHELDIQVVEYPRARLRFVMYSFSLEEAWVGV